MSMSAINVNVMSNIVDLDLCHRAGGGGGISSKEMDE